MGDRVTLVPPPPDQKTIYSMKLPPSISDLLERGETSSVFISINRDSRECSLDLDEQSFNVKLNDERAFVEVYEGTSKSCKKIGLLAGKLQIQRDAERDAIRFSQHEDRTQKTQTQLEPTLVTTHRPGLVKQTTKPLSTPSTIRRTQKKVSSVSRGDASSDPAHSGPESDFPTGATIGVKRSPSQGQIGQHSRPQSPKRTMLNGKPRPKSSSNSPAQSKASAGNISPPKRKEQGTSSGASPITTSRLGKSKLPPRAPSKAAVENDSTLSKDEAKALRRVLAVKPLTEEQIREKVARGTHSQVLERVADWDDDANRYSLKSDLWPEIIFEWDGYSEEDREAVIKNISRSQTLTETELHKLLEGEIPSTPDSYSKIKTPVENDKYRVEFNRKYRIYHTLEKSINNLREKLNRKRAEWSTSTGRRKDTITQEITDLFQKTEKKDRRMRDYYVVLHQELKELKSLIAEYAAEEQ